MSSDSISLNTSEMLAQGNRLRQLDVLRAIAILLVLFNHSWELLLPHGPFACIDKFTWQFGWTGVDLFFVLSGFLIGGLLFREIEQTGKLGAGRFLIRRAFKIWPGYFALIVYAVFRMVRHGKPLAVIAIEYWPNLLHFQNYTHNIRTHTWSLAVEEHFYLGLPLIIALVQWRRGSIAVRQWFIPAALIAMGVTAFFRTIHGIYWPYSVATHYFPTHLRIDALLFGVVLAHIATFSPRLWNSLLLRKRLLCLIGFLLISPMFFLPLGGNSFVSTGGYTMLYLGYGCILISVLAIHPGVGWDGKVLVSRLGRLLSWIGLYSYGIYLWHIDLAAQPIGFQLRHVWERLPVQLCWPVAMVIYLVVAVAIGAAMTILIEKPFLKLRDQVVPRRRFSAVPSAKGNDSIARSSSEFPDDCCQLHSPVSAAV